MLSVWGGIHRRGVRRGREGEAVWEQFLICFLSSIKTSYLLGEAMGKHCRIVIAIHLKDRTIKKIIHKKLAQDKFEGAGNGFTSIPVSQW